MTTIGAPRYNRIAQRLLQIKGDAPMPDLAAELTPTIELERERPEHAFLGGTRLCGRALTQPAVVGQRSTVRIRNPSGTNAIAILEKIVLATGAIETVGFYLGNATAELTTETLVGGYRDTRWGVSVNSTLILSRQDIAPNGQIFFQIGPLSANDPFELNIEDIGIILDPGGSLDLSTIGNNVALTVGHFWRERFMEPIEKQL